MDEALGLLPCATLKIGGGGEKLKGVWSQPGLQRDPVSKERELLEETFSRDDLSYKCVKDDEIYKVSFKMNGESIRKKLKLMRLGMNELQLLDPPASASWGLGFKGVLSCPAEILILI